VSAWKCPMSPKSRVRKKDPVPPRPPAAANDDPYRAYRRRRILIRVGVVLMIGAAGMALVHAGDHFGAFGTAQPAGLTDLLLGWPMSAVLLLIGAVMAGQSATPPKRRWRATGAHRPPRVAPIEQGVHSGGGPKPTALLGDLGALQQGQRNAGDAEGHSGQALPSGEL
jgi:hypothetical protein